MLYCGKEFKERSLIQCDAWDLRRGSENLVKSLETEPLVDC